MSERTPQARETGSFSLDDARELARRAHTGQVDKLGVAYIQHVEAVAAGLVDFDLDIQIAGMLHDVVEDSDLTLEDLLSRGVSERALRAIELVSRNLHPELSYHEGIARICTNRDATLVKIADNAHNSRPDRVTALYERTGIGPSPRYAAARTLLYAAVPFADVETVLLRVAPSLRDAVELQSMEDLLAYAEVEDMDDLPGWIDAGMDVDAALVRYGDVVTLTLGQYGFDLDLPMTLGDFWEQVHECEELALAQIESEG